jgi:hypothetical protein
MDGFENIANTVSASQDEEVWIESIYYKDRQHMKEVMSKMEKDESTRFFTALNRSSLGL